MNAELRVGVIIKTHGIKGEVKVYPTTDSPLRFEELTHVKLRSGRTELDLEIERVRFFKNLVILKFKGIDNINDVEQYKGADLYIPREEGLELEEGEYYIADIIDIRVVTDAGEELGTVRDVLETGANDVYSIWNEEEKREYLAPAIPDVVIDTDRG